jgi:hypothetical protein
MYNLILPNNVTNETSEVVVDGDILSIAMHGSYIIHGQHTTTTSHAKFNPETYTSFNMEYTWTLCNLTLLNSNDADRYIASDKLFAKLDGAEFYLYIRMDEEDNSVYILLDLENVSTKFKLPIEVQHKAELIDSNSAEHAAIDSSVLSYENEHKHAMEEDSITLDYSDFVLSMRQQCVTIKYHVAYKSILLITSTCSFCFSV